MTLKRAADPAGTTLVLAAHGSSRPGGDNPVPLLAERLGARRLFDEVRCGFLKQTPLLQDVVTSIRTPRIVVVPIVTGSGHVTDEIIPAALSGIDGATAVRTSRPLGAHPAIAGIMAERAVSVVAGGGLDGDRVSILVAAHGNRNNPGNAEQTLALVKRIAGLAGGLPVRAAFIEETPLISDWLEMTAEKNLIVLPFLIGGGLHGAEDVPAMLGLDGGDPAFAMSGGMSGQKTPFVGPLPAHGRQVWYCRALGHEPGLVEIVLQLAVERF